MDEMRRNTVTTKQMAENAVRTAQLTNPELRNNTEHKLRAALEKIATIEANDDWAGARAKVIAAKALRETE